ncbi:MAG: DUF2798 domain-containing protein [Gammaproteobacteria bacterium]|nr:DUF2798 domain-containing protein [Gammaproteobacteria bacterium]
MQNKARFIQPVVMSGIMAFMMTAAITYMNLGGVADFVARWLHAFVIAWPIAALAASVALPLSQRITRTIVSRLDGFKQPC